MLPYISGFSDSFVIFNESLSNFKRFLIKKDFLLFSGIVVLKHSFIFLQIPNRVK